MLSVTVDDKESQPSTSSDDKESQPSTSSIQPSLSCPHIDFPEILKATEDFAESLVIGKGGFGKVYKGNIVIGGRLVVAAIKRLDSMSNQGADEFWAEVKMLSMLHNRNIVSLIGYCIHENEKMLVYEYMPNGTLDDHLHKLRTPLSWLQRLNICVGAGRGLRYLHNEVKIDSGVIHRDFKSSNILLHENWAAKISDFGLSKMCPTNQQSTYVNTRVKGTYGYFDPSYYHTGILTRKSDVYAFGVVLLEVLCRKRAVDRSLDEEQWGLVPWVQESIKEGNLKHKIDSDIRSEISPKCLKEFVRIAERCLHNNPKQRPTMAEVVVGLEFVLVLQEKFNNSLQPAHKTIFGRIIDMLPFTFNKENSVQGVLKLSSSRSGYSMYPERKEVPADSESSTASAKEFRFDELKKATRKFSLDLLLGEGAFGKVFLGWVDHNTSAPSKQGVGLPVAVKTLGQQSLQGHAEWLAEIKFLGHVAHPNIIRLLGYCIEEPMLVYEYMPNKTFFHFLFSDIAEPLSWGTRLSIMLGVARALTYSHSKNIILRDLKSSDIFLDDGFNAKLGDFGLAKYRPESHTHVSTAIKGTSGYIDPVYFMTGHLTMKTDIYSFGVVLLESITGQKAMDVNRPQKTLLEWVSFNRSKRREIKEMMDPRLKSSYPAKGASKCFTLALRCVEKIPKKRPSSEEVLQSLEQIYSSNDSNNIKNRTRRIPRIATPSVVS